MLTAIWRRYARRAVWSYLALCLLIAALIQFTGDRWWLSTVLLYGPRWVWALPLLALVPLCLISQRVLLWPLAAAAALVAWPIMGWHFSSQPHGTADRSDLRLLTYNIGGVGAKGLGTVKLADLRWLVDFVKADIALFQECNYNDEALRVVFPEYDVDSGFDACMVSRFLVTKVDRRDREDIHALHGAGVIDRFEMLSPRGPMSLLNLHLETPRKGLELIFSDPLGMPAAVREVIALRRIESRAARLWAMRAATPQIIVGDFNMPQESGIYQDFWSRFNNALATCGRGYAFTKFTNHWGIRIDHVLLDPHWECTQAYVLGSLGGDHRPVFVSLRMR